MGRAVVKKNEPTIHDICPIGWMPAEDPAKCLDCMFVAVDGSCGFDHEFGKRYPFVWMYRKWPCSKWLGDDGEANLQRDERRGHRCRVLVFTPKAAQGPHNILVEFVDGERMVATQYAVRKVRKR